MLASEDIARIGGRYLEEVRRELRLAPDLTSDLRAESPCLVANLDEEPSHWLVPLAIDERLAGFVRIALDGQVMAWGRWGDATAAQELPSRSVLSREIAEGELRQEFASSHADFTPAVLVHDGAPERVAWMVRATSPEGPRLLFWSFGFSYSRDAGSPTDRLEL